MSDVHEVVRHQPDLDQRDDEDQSRRDSAESEQVIDTKEVGADGERASTGLALQVGLRCTAQLDTSAPRKSKA